MEMYITKVGMCDESGDVTKVGIFVFIKSCYNFTLSM